MTMNKSMKCDKLISVAENYQSYWCKFCNRHIKPLRGDDRGGMVFVHDAVFHPADHVYDSGDIHVIN